MLEGDRELKRCPECKELIDKEAQRCKNCMSSLNWQRHLHVSNSTLALLLAFFSVSAILVERLSELLDDPDSSVSLSPAAVKDDVISAAIVNYGDRPGWVASAGVLVVVSLEGYGDTSLDVQVKPVNSDFPVLVSKDLGEVAFSRSVDGVIFPTPERIPEEESDEGELDSEDDQSSLSIVNVFQERDEILASLLYVATTKPREILECKFYVSIDNFSGEKEVLSRRLISSSYYDFFSPRELGADLASLSDNASCAQYLSAVYDEELPKVSEMVNRRLEDRFLNEFPDMSEIFNKDERD